MKKLLIVGSIGFSLLLSSCSNGSGSSVNNPENCESYSNQSGEYFSLCEKSKTYEYKSKKGKYVEITDSIEYNTPIDKWYVLDDKDTIIVKYPNLVDEKYDYIYIATNTTGTEWVTYKELK